MAPSSTARAPARRRSRTRASTRCSPRWSAPTRYAESDYHSLQAALNRRFSSNVQSQLSYTLSRCRDTTSGNSPFEGGTAATNPYDEDYDYGPCLIDRTHNLRASAIYQLPFTANAFVAGWQVSAIVSAVSGAPFTPLVGFDQAGLQTGGTQRPNLASGRSLDDAVTGGTPRHGVRLHPGLLRSHVLHVAGRRHARHRRRARFAARPRPAHRGSGGEQERRPRAATRTCSSAPRSSICSTA